CDLFDPGDLFNRQSSPEMRCDCELQILRKVQHGCSQPLRLLPIAKYVICGSIVISELRSVGCIERRHPSRPPNMIQERRVRDPVQPGEDLGSSVKPSQRGPSLLVRLLSEICG